MDDDQNLMAALQKVVSNKAAISKNAAIVKFANVYISELIKTAKFKEILEKLALKYEVSKSEAMEGMLLAIKEQLESYIEHRIAASRNEK